MTRRPYAPWFNRNTASLRMALVAILLALQTAAALAHPAESTLVRTNPMSVTIATGETASVTLYVQEVADLYGADIRLTFDPAILQVVDADPSAAGVQIAPVGSFLQPDFVVKRKACNAPDPADPDCAIDGLVWYAATQVNPSAPASGSGPLATITFRRIAPGDTALRIVHQELVTRSGAQIPAQAVDGSARMPGAAHWLWLPGIRR